MTKILLALLWISFFCFWFDLFHMVFHLSKQPALWKISGVGLKLLLKGVLFAVPLSFLLTRKKWTAVLTVLIFLGGPVRAEAAFWDLNNKTACQSAREMLEDSGTARDAKENLFGAIKLEPPQEKFPRDADKVTWWGKFQPFEFWKSPEFTAAWLNPQGQEVARQNFKGAHCALAKSTLPAPGLPRGEFQPGIWKVIVTCEDYLIDQRYFEVQGPRIPYQNPPPDLKAGNTQPITIWAKEKV